MAVTLENATLRGRPTEEATGVHIEDEIRSFCIIGDDSPTLFSPGTLLLTFRRGELSTACPLRRTCVGLPGAASSSTRH